MDHLWRDVCHSFRLLSRNRSFAATALLTLAVGIGANTTVFSVVSSVILQPLPYQQPNRLVVVWSENPRLGLFQAPTAFGNIADWRERSRTLEDLAVLDDFTATVTVQGQQLRRTSACFASPNLFPLLSVSPLAGRLPTNVEVERRDPVALISHRFWQQQFQGDPGVLERELNVDGRLVRIVGVVPALPNFPVGGGDLWLPHTAGSDWPESRIERGTGSWRVVARLAPGVSRAAAQTEMSGIAAALERAHPAENAGLGVRLVPLSEQLAGPQLRLALYALAGAVGAVLLIACGNIANLLLARGTARQRELAVRLSLGATRGRLVRQLLVENVVLAALAAVLGTALSILALDAVRVFGPDNVPRLEQTRLDVGVLSFTALLALVSAVLFGLAPALRVTARDPSSMLSAGGRGMTESAAARRVRAALVVVEFALAVVLLTGAGLLLRSFAKLLIVDPGFRVEGVLVASSWFPRDRDRAGAIPYVRRMIEQVEALPGVTAAGFSEEVLLSHRRDQAISVDGATADRIETVRVPLSIDAVTPGWFRVMEIALRRGRLFSEQDGAGSLPVVIINETLARRLWPGADPVGRRLRVGEDEDASWVTVVGVVADLRRQGLDRIPLAQAFMPFAQNPSRPLNLVVRTNLDPSALIPTVRTAIRAVDATVPEFDIRTLRQEIDHMFAPRQFHTGLLTVFAGIALLLAGIGVFGVLHYSVARRTHEIGVRMALGARRKNVLAQILREGLALALTGITLGAVAAAFLLRSLSSLLYGVGPLDPISFVVAIAALLIVALLACYLPARRAASVDPMIALRVE